VTRGSYSTPATPALRPSAASFPLSDPRSYTWRDYGRTVTSSITPTDFAVPVLAAALADKWLEVVKEQGGGENSNLTAAVRRFLRASASRSADAR
jgi:hypothetical protein